MIKLVCRVEKELAFLIRFKDITLHSALIQLILCHEGLVIFLLDQFDRLCLRHVDSKIEITEQYLHTVVLDLVSVILSASLTFIDHLSDLIQLLVTFVNVSRVQTSTKMAIQEDKRAVLKSKSHSYRTLVSFGVSGIGLHRCHGNIKNTSLYF